MQVATGMIRTFPLLRSMPHSDSERRVCRICSADLPLTEFYQFKTDAGFGYYRKCKTCVKAAVRRNREDKRAYYKAYFAKRYQDKITRSMSKT